MPVSKPTPGATGWNTAVDAVIDIANSVADLPTRVTALEAAGIGDVTEAELAAGLATKANTVHTHTEYLDQDAGDNRYILQTNASGFATDTELATGLATKAAATDVVSLNDRVNGLETAPPAHAHTIGDITAPGTRDDTTFLRGDGTWAQPPAGTGGGVTDHGALTGLADDDHTQYHTDARGDVRYYTKAQVDTTTAGLTPTARTVTAGTGLTGGGDLTANRTLAVAYGTVTGTAAQGNDTRITGAAQKSANLSDLANVATARTNLGASQVTVDGTPVGTLALDSSAVTATSLGAIPVSLVNAKGDLLVGTADDSLVRVPAGSNGQVLTADSTLTPGVKWDTPAAGAAVITDSMSATSHGFPAWAYDAVLADNTSVVGANPVFTRMVVEVAGSVSGLVINITIAGATPTAGQCFASLLDSAGTVIASTGDIGSQLTSIGAKTLPWATAPTLAVGQVVYAMVNFTMTTTPSLSRRSLGAAGIRSSASVPWRFGVKAPAYTSPPTSVDLSTLSVNSVGLWMALAP